MEKLQRLLSQPKEVPLKLVPSTVPGCRILVKYFRRKNGLEMFSVVKKKVQSRCPSTGEHSLWKLFTVPRSVGETCKCWGSTPGWEQHTSCRGRFWAVCCLQLHAFDDFSSSLRYSIHSSQKSFASSHRGLPWTVGRCGFCHLCFESLSYVWYR